MSLESPSLPWRTTSSVIMGLTGCLSRMFLYGANTTEAHGLEGFLKTLDERRDVSRRQRGLLTVSNHICVMDDPLIWGVLPFRYAFNPMNHRWAFGSHDICFTNKFRSAFFTLGQTLPAHRLMHSPYGGLFQPTMTQAIRLFAKEGFNAPSELASSDKVSFSSSDLSDPFSSAQLSYTTTGLDSFLAPSAYTCNQYGWIHIHPEGMVHQSNHNTMRYFKWGVARLILEPPECPDVVPMFIEGTNQVMPADRRFPTFVPRAGKKLAVTFGEKVDTEKIFGDLRTKWSKLKAKAGLGDRPLGELNEELMHGTEAVELRKECTRRVRAEVIKVRKSRSYSDEDPKEGLAETWKREGPRQEGRMNDGTWVEQP